MEIKNKKFDKNTALKFGFQKINNCYKYKTPLLNNNFLLEIEIFETNKIITKLIETETNELYTLHLSNATGDFVGKIREEYNKIINEITEKCFKLDVFKAKQTKEVIKYIKEKYNDDMEHLWEKFPDCAIARRKDNKKWYLIIMTIKKSKLDLETDDIAEVIDLRANTDNIEKMISKDNIYPGYHMNKKHWITIILDWSMNTKELCCLIDESYESAKKK